MFLMGFGVVVCVCVGVFGVLPWWGEDVFRYGARVFFFIVGLDCGDNGVRVCCDFVCYGVPDCLQVWLISGSGL